MADERITSGLADGVLSVEIDRPGKKNALTLAMYGGLVEALRRLEAEPDIRVLLLSGAGGVFTSGNDLADFIVAPPLDEASPAFRFIEAIAKARKPIVAAVEGLAVGVGVTMLLHCDLVYAGAGTVFQLPFVNLGLCPEAGSSLLLPRIAGHRVAAELLLLGEPFSATRAREAGIVNEVVADGSALTTARAKAQRIAAQPAEALRLTKALLKTADSRALEETMRIEAGHFRERLGSPEARKAFAAFMDRGKADPKK